MPWQRRGARRYFYRGSGTKRTYLGRGDTAHLAAEHDVARRKLDDSSHANFESMQRKLLAADELVLRFIDMAVVMTEAIIVAAGYHRHDRGPWRRRRSST